MNAHVQQLLEEVRRLPNEQREQLLDALIADEQETIEEDPELMSMITQRLQEIDSGAVKCISWEDMKRNVIGETHGSSSD